MGIGTINNRLIFGGLFAAFVVYSGLVYTSGTQVHSGAAMNEMAAHGQDLFQQHNCIACHQFYGLGGYMGPDLTNVISNRGEAYAGAFIAAGTASMPNFGLDADEVAALVAYLAYVDSTGTYPPQEYQVQWNGLVSQADDPQ